MRTARIKVRLAQAESFRPGRLLGFDLVKFNNGKVAKQWFATREMAHEYAEANGYALRYSG